MICYDYLGRIITKIGLGGVNPICKTLKLIELDFHSWLTITILNEFKLTNVTPVKLKTIISIKVLEYQTKNNLFLERFLETPLC